MSSMALQFRLPGEGESRYASGVGFSTPTTRVSLPEDLGRVVDATNQLLALWRASSEIDLEAPAPSTFLHGLRVLLALPSDLPIPDISLDEESFFEFEWATDDRQFSLYVTDTPKVAFAYIYDRDNYGSGYLRVESVFDPKTIAGIRQVFVEAQPAWLQLVGS